MIKIVSLVRESLVNILGRERAVHYYRVLADMMRIGRYYAQLICELLGRDDYIVVDSAGKCKITPKGGNLLKDLTRFKGGARQISPHSSIPLEKTIEEVHGSLIEPSTQAL